RRSYSSFDPSTQWIAAGFVSSAIFSTHRSKCLFSLNGVFDVARRVGSIVFAAATVTPPSVAQPALASAFHSPYARCGEDCHLAIRAANSPGESSDSRLAAENAKS